jgi:hypothetical protein
MNRALALLLLLLACATAAPAPAPAPAIKDTIDDYAKLHRMTEKPYRVPPRPPTARCWQAPPRHGPHDSADTFVFMNDLAVPAFSELTAYPIGSVIVKEKIPDVTEGSDRRRNHLAGMIKRTSSSPPSVDDWEFFYADDERNLSAAKVLQSCKDCHANASETDFVFGDWSKPRS